jgi:hypothetical protein
VVVRRNEDRLVGDVAHTTRIRRRATVIEGVLGGIFWTVWRNVVIHDAVVESA